MNDYLTLIELTTKIAKYEIWNEFSENKNIIINDNGTYIDIELLNNGWNMYFGNNNIYEHNIFATKEQYLSNIYELEKLRKYSYASLEFYCFSYLYSVNIDNEMIDIYDELKIDLERNIKYVNCNYKGKGQISRIISLEQIKDVLPVLKIFLRFIELFQIKKTNFKNNDKVIYLEVSSADLKIEEKDYSSLNITPISPDLDEFQKKLQIKKIINKTLLIDMRYITACVTKNYYHPLVIATYDDTDEILHHPFIFTKGLDLKTLITYILKLLPNGIYQTIIVYNFDLYLILKKLFGKYNIYVSYEEESDILDCIYDDYEEIIDNNGLE